MNKELNYTILYGVVTAVKRNYIRMDFGGGTIKVRTEDTELDLSRLKVNYTIGVNGRLRAGFIKLYLLADTISILDKKPHKFPGI